MRFAQVFYGGVETPPVQGSNEELALGVEDRDVGGRIDRGDGIFR